jgi:PrgI family protein
MSPRENWSDEQFAVRIPADVDREDRLLADLTARQVAILAATGAVLWLAFTATRHLVPPAVFAGAAAPFALAAVMLALGRRDGLSLDRLATAAVRQARSPRRLVPASEGIHPPPTWIDPAVAAQAGPPPAPLRLPATAIHPGGPVSLGGDGAVAIAAASTVNFALRTPAEQQALTAAFGRWLNSLQHPAQILIRAHRIDLSAMVTELRDNAPALPHPALERAALGHAAFLGGLAEERDLLARQVLVTVREPTAERAWRRIGDAARALAAADLAVTPLDGPQSAAVLAACCAPDRQPASAGRAPASQFAGGDGHAAPAPGGALWPGA